MITANEAEKINMATETPEFGTLAYTAFCLDRLKTTLCQCGGEKKSMRSVCPSCFGRLPRRLKNALYDKIGNGYEAAYFEALEFLGAKSRRSGA